MVTKYNWESKYDRNNYTYHGISMEPQNINTMGKKDYYKIPLYSSDLHLSADQIFTYCNGTLYFETNYPQTFAKSQ